VGRPSNTPQHRGYGHLALALGLYISSRFYPFDPDQEPGAVLLDTSAVLDDSPDFDPEIVEHLAQAVWHLLHAGSEVTVECAARPLTAVPRPWWNRHQPT
jgi:hypothetical protein